MKLTLKKMDDLAITIRQEIVEMLLEAKSGHCAGPLGAVELYVALYFSGIFRIIIQNPAKIKSNIQFHCA